MRDRREATFTRGDGDMTSGPGDEMIEVGDDGRARLEKDMGLKIDPETGHAYESQGNFQNMGIGAGGAFYNGVAVPRSVKCAACSGIVAEDSWGRGFLNCGSFQFGDGSFFLCRECVMRALQLFPTIKGMVAAMNGGDVRRG